MINHKKPSKSHDKGEQTNYGKESKQITWRITLHLGQCHEVFDLGFFPHQSYQPKPKINES
jgi:hypothetical protein